MKPKRSRSRSDIEIIGARTSFIAVLGSLSIGRNWLEGMPQCPFLATHHIAHTGIMTARYPYEIIRINQSGTFMLACLEGEGVIMVDGFWKTISAGQACLLPPFVMNSLKCKHDHKWRFAWVRYEEPRHKKPIVSSISPVIGFFDEKGLHTAITGLYQEVIGDNNPSALHRWCELIHHYVIRFAEPSHLDERLWRLWNTIETNLSHDWTLESLSEIACLSKEHLRRLCLKEMGRSPMRHLSFIRLQMAIHLLSTSDDKIDTIAKAVGFSSIHSFSNAFRMRFGRTPSEFR